MRVTWKFVVLTLALTTVTMLTLIWRNQAFLKAERQGEARNSMETQTQLISSVVRGKTEFLVNQMTQFVYVRSATRSLNASAQQILGHFDTVALLTVADNRSWSARWVEKNTRTAQGRFPEAFLAGLFTTLPIASMDQSAPSWSLVQDAQKRPALALLNFVQLTTSESNAPTPGLMIGIVNPAYLADAVKSYAGSPQMALIVDNLGRVLAHSDSQWMGQDISDGRLMKAVSDEKGASFFKTIVSENNQNQWVAASPIALTNLTAVLAIPTAMAGAGLPALQLLILGFGILVVAGFTSFMLARSLEPEVGALTIEPTPFQEPSVPVKAVTPPPILAPPFEPGRESALFRRFSAGVSQELKAPMVALLGNVQIVLSKTHEDETKNQAKTIEKEARKIKKVIDALAKFAGLDGQDTKSVHLPDLLEKVLKGLETELKGVAIEKNLATVQRIHAHSRQIEIICEELIRNALQAMASAPSRCLSLIVEPNGASVRLRVKDTGPGISADVRAKMFDPFVSSEQTQRIGLGLSVVRSLLLDQGAHISVNSEASGTEMIVDFLPDSEIPRLAKARDVLKSSDSKGKELGPLLKEPLKKTELFSTQEEMSIPLTDQKFLFAKSEPSPSLALPSKSSGDDFKVKIRRPKLKVDN